jgi:hypothetical protein
MASPTVERVSLEQIARVAPPSPVCDRRFAENSPVWSLPTRIGFRFFFAYLILFTFHPLYLGVPWVERHVFRLSHVGAAAMNGSGDTTYAYVDTFCALVAACVIAFVWSLLDRKRTNYVRLHQWFRLGVRLALGAAMLLYGAAKVIPSQMPAPYPAALMETYGDSSPMRLLWTFIGASKPYEIFCGASEMLGGILLFVPALATLGSLICIAVLTNVFILNMCYDVPVKIFSFHLLVMAVFLAAPELRNLVNLFLFQRRVELTKPRPLFRRRWLNRTVLGLQLLAGVGLASLFLYGSHQNARELAIKSPYYGVWSVEEYAVDGNVQPATLSEVTRWRRVILDFPQRLTLQFVDAPQQKFLMNLDQYKQSLTLTKLGDDNRKTELAMQHPSNDVLILDGLLDGHRIHAKLHREDERKFLLTSRGFHWINEYPNNR